MGVVDRFSMKGRVAILSGAGRGIGAASALALAEAGADIAVMARSADQIESVAARARELGRRAIAIPTDANDPDAVTSAVARTIAELGRIDVVVNVVGGAMPQPFMTTRDKDLRASFENNVVNGLRLVRECVPHLLTAAEGRLGGSSVVMVSSAIGHVVGRGYVAYGSAKAALDHAVELMAADLNPRIRVNAVAPGAIMTDALEVVAANPDLKAAIESATPLRRIGDPDDIAAAVLYLASDASNYVTGQIVCVDGGVTTTNFALPIADL
jgi:7-alpha-hydroxysteroid dehydrogenase